jgi:hypothetical protein
MGANPNDQARVVELHSFGGKSFLDTLFHPTTSLWAERPMVLWELLSSLLLKPTQMRV